MVCQNPQQRVYEITGPRAYSSVDIAKIFGDVLNRNVALQQVLTEEWENTLLQVGFSKVIPSPSPDYAITPGLCAGLL